MTTKTVKGYYGSNNTPCNVFVCSGRAGNWYCVEDSVNVNLTPDEIEPGVNVELVDDIDMFTAGSPINSEEELLTEVEA